MNVRFVYYEGCPSHEQALQRLRKIMRDEGIEPDVDIVKVETPEDAERLRFIGSPTILINGRDIDPPTEQHFSLTCRAYRLEDGRISPLPPEQMIRRAIRDNRAKQ